MQDFDGIDVIDADGHKIGTVDRTYDDDEGISRFIEVTTGSLFSKQQHLVPVDGAQLRDNGLHLPYSKQVVDDSPDASSADDSLQGGLLDSVRSYYQGEPGTGTPGTSGQEQQVVAVPVGEAAQPVGAESNPQTGPSGQEIGAVRDLGDVIEVPVVEEELIKRPVVKEVLRIRKTQVGEQRTVGADVRKEDVEVSQEGDVTLRDSQSQET